MLPIKKRVRESIRLHFQGYIYKNSCTSGRVNLWTHKHTRPSVSDLSSLASLPSHPSTMLPLNDALHGWSPIGADDEDVTVSPHLPPLTMVSHSMAPSSDRRAQRNRNRDPSWIPRPRNAFIIFRCEYSREHSQGAQDPQSDDDSTNPIVKTLSKRAAEAWKQLPAAERERYKLLADKEREEHARLYPHYRFRPMKRQTPGQGKTSRERSQGPRTPSVERLSALSAYLPSVLARAPEKPQSSPPVEHTNASTAVPQAERLSLPEPTFPIDPQAGVSCLYRCLST